MMNYFVPKQRYSIAPAYHGANDFRQNDDA